MCFSHAMCSAHIKMRVPVPSLNFHVDKYLASYAPDPRMRTNINVKCPLLSVMSVIVSSRVATSGHTDTVSLMELLLSFIAAKTIHKRNVDNVRNLISHSLMRN